MEWELWRFLTQYTDVGPKLEGPRELHLGHVDAQYRGQKRGASTSMA